MSAPGSAMLMSNTVAKTQDTTFIAANLFRGFVAKFIEVWKYRLYLLEYSNDETQQFVFKPWAKSALGGVRKLGPLWRPREQIG